jgi:hypothetical protein
MKKKDIVPRLKEVLRKKDSRFWLMVFVLASTLVMVFLWTASFRGFFSGASISRDIEKMGFSEMSIENQEVNEFLENINKVFDSFNEEKNIDDNNFSKNNTLSSDLDEDRIEDLKEKINQIVAEREEGEENSTSTAIISDEIIKSDEVISELRAQIKELEEKLNN